MRAMPAFFAFALLIAATASLHAQSRREAIEPRIPRAFRGEDIHPLTPNHRLDTITLGGFVRPAVSRPVYIVTVKLTSIADGRTIETKWPSVVMNASESSTIDKVKRREFTVAAGPSNATTKLESSPTVVTLEEGSRAEIRLLESGDDLITVDVIYEELAVREGGTVNVRDQSVAEPQQTTRRIRTFRTAKLGSDIGIPLDAASSRDAKQVLQLQVSRK